MRHVRYVPCALQRLYLGLRHRPRQFGDDGRKERRTLIALSQQDRTGQAGQTVEVDVGPIRITLFVAEGRRIGGRGRVAVYQRRRDRVVGQTSGGPSPTRSLAGPVAQPEGLMF
jgi:hypothetical protein